MALTSASRNASSGSSSRSSLPRAFGIKAVFSFACRYAIESSIFETRSRVNSLRSRMWVFVVPRKTAQVIPACKRNRPISSARSHAPAFVIFPSFNKCRFRRALIASMPPGILARCENCVQFLEERSPSKLNSRQGASSNRTRPSWKKNSRISSLDICWEVAPTRKKNLPPKE